MGQTSSKGNFASLKNGLRKAKARIGIHRNQRNQTIIKKKKEIESHLKSGNEALALIHVKELFTVG